MLLDFCGKIPVESSREGMDLNMGHRAVAFWSTSEDKVLVYLFSRSRIMASLAPFIAVLTSSPGAMDLRISSFKRGDH